MSRSEFRLLGPVEVWGADGVVDAGQPRQRCVLAALLVDAGRLVTGETLVDRVWGETPPDSARQTLYSYLTRIRNVLARAAAVGDGAAIGLHRRSGGYLLDVDPDRVDLHRFRHLVDHTRDKAQPDEQRAAVLTEALALWRGEPLAGLTGQWVARMRDGWHQQRVDAVVAWAQAQLRLGNASAVVEPVNDLLRHNPLAENLIAQLMRALYATGHTAAALNCYTAARHLLAEELGTDPGADLQALHTAILRGDRELVVPGARVAVIRPVVAVPGQLPMQARGFTGRQQELGRLDALLATADRDPTAVVVVTISGTAGVGKTTLALYWAHQIAPRFPDGQLFVNLRGFDPAGAPVRPAAAVRGFLDALEVPPHRIPADITAQTGLYRSLLAERRMLIVLDNARDTHQIRQLLPGSPGCLVLVTSRNPLTSLVATEAAQPVTLDLLTGAEGRDLLARRLGGERVRTEPEAVDDIVTQCARLPLALAIVAARAATLHDLPLTTLAGEMRNAHPRLDAFDTGEAFANVRTIFSWSYRCLSAPAARLFRMFGLHPGPDISAPAAAALGGLSRTEVRPLLAELISASLIDEHLPGRYTAHDLLWAYATEQAQHVDSEQQRRHATHRMLDHYLHSAHAAALGLNKHRDVIALAPPQPGVTPERPADQRHALAWFMAEHRVLLAAVDHAAATGWDSHAWQLAWTTRNYLHRRGRWHDWIAMERTALGAARRLNDPALQAKAHRNVARAVADAGRYDEAYTHLQRTLDWMVHIDDHVGQAQAHLELAYVSQQQGGYAEALDRAQQALGSFRVAGRLAEQADALNLAGWCQAQLGDLVQALASCEQALALYQKTSDHDGQAATWDSIGQTYLLLGHHAQAIDSYQHAIHLRREHGDRYYESSALEGLGDTYHAANDLAAARTAWQQALVILDELDHPDADQVRAKLAALNVGRAAEPDAQRGQLSI